ncbi:MAG: methylated-DNA--[protein]-cysteine S-methyltransferase [Nitrospirae bacterium]|nr:MAG: methylated-DNA--[protein]-cysteine S-methyltransferase [Nitrospirota bacterium]
MKAKKAGSELVFDIFESPVGVLHLIFSGRNLTRISFKRPACRRGRTPALFKGELEEYFEGERDNFSQATVFLEGTDFEKKVWLALRDIPYGETRAYKWLAEKIGNTKATRAVGQALGRNPIPIVLPCHRVIESDGSIGGYSSGVDIKRRLLEIEYYNVISKKL